MGKNAPHFRTKHTNDQFAGRNLRAFSRTAARPRGPTRGTRRLHRNTRTKRESTECITTTMDQLELMDSIGSGCSPRPPSNKRGRGREVLYQEVSTTKPYSDDVSTKKHRPEPNKEQPSKGHILLMVTQPKYVEPIFIWSLPECITIVTMFLSTTLFCLYLCLHPCVRTKCFSL